MTKPRANSSEEALKRRKKDNKFEINKIKRNPIIMIMNSNSEWLKYSFVTFIW